MKNNAGSQSTQNAKIQQKGGFRHYLFSPLSLEIVARTIRHYLVAALLCSAYLYDGVCLGACTRTIRLIVILRVLFVLPYPLLLHSLYAFGGELNTSKMKEPQRGTITCGLRGGKLRLESDRTATVVP